MPAIPTIVAALLALPPAGAPATPPPAGACLVEVRLRDVPPPGREKLAVRDVQLDEGAFSIQAGRGKHESGTRIPVVTYSFKRSSWNAVTTFQDTGTRVEIQDLHRRPDGRCTFAYTCEVTAVLAVVAPGQTPILGTVTWHGTGTTGPGQPLVLRGRQRVNRRLLVVPPNHPLHDPKVKPPERDLQTEITLTLKLGGPPPKGA